jgi:ABC-type antimicrobial peptide transport system permease subunit
MKFSDVLRMCVRNLTKRKIRTSLTVLGVIIGTCAIVVMISLGYGMNEAMDKMIGEWADLTLIEVYNFGGRNPDGTEVPDLTDDIIAGFKDLPSVVAATPFMTSLWIGGQIAIYSEELAISSGSFIGVYMDELEAFGYTLLEGRWKTASDPSGTVIVGQQFGSSAYDFVYDEYLWPQWPDDYDEFGNPTVKMVDPMTTELRIIPLTMDTSGGWWNADYSVIGSETAPNKEYDRELNVIGMIEGSWRDWYTMEGVFVDIEFLNEYIKAYNELNPDMQFREFDGTYDNVRIRVDDMNNVQKVEEELQKMGYQTYSMTQARDRMREQIQLIQLLLSALAGVSLFVAALNIMNTMITAVVERTREIGIMKVLGCDISKILMLFLGEAALIGFLGGVLGIGLSYLSSFLLNTFLMDVIMQAMYGGGMLAEGVSISQIPLWLPLFGLLFATAVGVVSGFYPAYRGTRISALSAIAHE